MKKYHSSSLLASRSCLCHPSEFPFERDKLTTRVCGANEIGPERKKERKKERRRKRGSEISRRWVVPDHTVLLILLIYKYVRLYIGCSYISKIVQSLSTVS